MSDDDQLLGRIEADAFAYFQGEQHPATGLVADRTSPGAPSSIAAVGMALSAYPIGVERGWLTRAEAVQRTLAVLRFFRDSHQGPEPDATGHHGFYYHFLDMETGRRANRCELSTMDSALLLAGALTAAAYFDRGTPDERAIGKIAELLYSRADWTWALNGGDAVTHGWRPRSGFLRFRWTGYSEALILYILALGSPTHPLPAAAYQAWTSTYRWKRTYGHDWLYAGPLFIHQLSHAWIDFRGIQDAFMRDKGSDYFENSRRATLVQHAYAIRNPRGWAGYGPEAWGITASDGPGPARAMINGRNRRFYDYTARGVPFGPDDGTLVPWAVASSLPFAPEIVLPTLRRLDALPLRNGKPYGCRASFNPSFPARDEASPAGWVSPWHYGLHEGPVVMMIENFRSGLVWKLMRRCPFIARGLRRAGFTEGGAMSTR